MSKKDPTKLKSYDVVHLNFGEMSSTFYNEREKDLDPYQPSKADIIEGKKARRNESFFKKIQDKLFHNVASKQRSNNNLSLNEKKELEIEHISCHFCGNICKENDFFCAECGAKLKPGHYND